MSELINAQAAVGLLNSVVQVGNPGGVSILGTKCALEGCGNYTHFGFPNCPLHYTGIQWQDKDSKMFCLHCFQEFHTFTRRKHHCRCCGAVFCGDCADYLPNGNSLTLPLHKPGEAHHEQHICIDCASVIRPGTLQKTTLDPLYKMFKHLPLDIVFCFDSTGSMGPFIHNVENNIDEIINDIHRHHYVDMHMGAVGYRDHQYGTLLANYVPMQNHHKKFDKLIFHIHSTTAEGNDYPEAMSVGLAIAQKLTWRPQSVKMLVVITDAPPHGCAYPQDAYPQGDPTGLNPFALADTLANDGVNIYTIGVEPESATSGADRVLQDIARRGRGLYCALEPHHHLHHRIAAIACTLTMQGIVSEELAAANGNQALAAQAAFARMKANTMPQLNVGPNGVIYDVHRQPMTADRIYSEYIVPGNLPPPPPFNRYN